MREQKQLKIYYRKNVGSFVEMLGLINDQEINFLDYKRPKKYFLGSFFCNFWDCLKH